MYEADRTWIFERPKHSLQLLACRAEIQLNNFPNFVVVADELALDFENFRDTRRGNYRTELTAEQASCFDSLERSLSELNEEACSNGAVNLHNSATFDAWLPELCENLPGHSRNHPCTAMSLFEGR
jgi:hypothetical protein